MPNRPTFAYNPLSYAYPDDESDKELCLQASPRTLFLYWVNITFSDGEEVWQVVRLDRREDDNARDAHKWVYVYPDMIVVDGPVEREDNATHSLGVFTRDQREAVLECAEDVPYEASGEDEQGLRWMSELLERMVSEGLVARVIVDKIREAVSVI